MGNPAASSPSPSLSARRRTRGNELYQQALNGGFCLFARRAKLARALVLYKQALDASSSADEKASSFKNLGMASWLLCRIEIDNLLAETEEFHGYDNLLLCKSHLSDAVSAFSKALEHGRNAKPQPWVDHLHNVLESIVHLALEYTSSFSMSHAPLLQYVSEAFEDAVLHVSLRLLAYKTYAESLFHRALVQSSLDDQINYRCCQRLLELGLVTLRKARSLSLVDGFRGHDEMRHILSDIEDLEQSLDVHLCICEAMQAIALGDVCLSEGSVDAEGLRNEKVFDSLDWYRHASLVIRERDMETEAIAMCRIGKVYSECLRMPDSAHKFYFQSVRLALTVMSQRIEKAEWYQYSSNKVRVHQEQIVAREQETKNKSREASLQRLKEKLDALRKEADKGAGPFLNYIYAQHPLPDLKRNIVPTVGTSKQTKASLKKAILHYHPDTNASYGDDWKVLTEEICRYLNDKYACFKGV